METGYRISPRQLKRMLILETGSVGCLFAAAWTGVENGVLIVLSALVGSLLYGALLMAVGRTDGGYYAMTERELPGFLWRLLWGIYIARFAIRGAWILSYLEYLIQSALYSGGRLMILIPLLLVCGYAGIRNPEGRARFAELMFWWIILPLAGLFLVGLWRADLPELMPEANVNLPEILSGEYQLMALFLPAELMLFRVSAVEGTDRKVWRAGMQGVLWAGLWLLLVYVVTAGILGTVWSGGSLLGVPEAMELISARGGSLERLDILLILVWLAGGVMTLSAYFCQGQQLLRRMLPGKCRPVLPLICVVLLTTAILFAFPDAERWSDWYRRYARWVDFPLSVLFPVWIWLVYRRKSGRERKRMWKGLQKKAVKEFCLGVLLLTAAGTLCGCTGQASIEDRTYVESIHILPVEAGYQYRCMLSYMDEQSMESLQAGISGAAETQEETESISDDGSGQGGNDEQEYTASAADIDGFNDDYYRLTGSRLDYSHLEGIYLAEALYRSEEAETVLEDIREETQAVLSTPVYQEGMEIGDQSGETLGDWLKQEADAYKGTKAGDTLH